MENDLGIEIGDGLKDKFSETVDAFMENAMLKERELSIGQISSSFLYTSAFYSARYYNLKAKEEKIDVDEFINEHIEFFATTLRNGIEHFSSKEEDS